MLAHEELKDEVCVDCVADPHLYREIGQIASSCGGSLQARQLHAAALPPCRPAALPPCRPAALPPCRPAKVQTCGSAALRHRL